MPTSTPDNTMVAVNQHSPPGAKIALFRNLFRGRDDVYPRRFESRKTGKSGYQPACANEWARDLCDKRTVKCTDCPYQRFLPLTDETIRQHLSGQDATGRDFTAGVYPMLRDETCFFLAVDFDKESWPADTGAFLETCQQLNIPASLERSRSGRGGHVWLFFSEPIPAGLARKFGSHILTETMERRPDIGLDSYDRLFPNQDTMPIGGLGNLIALPLQKKPRELGNTVFLDEQFNPPPDQWAFLSTVQKISRSQAEVIVHDAEMRGRVMGVRLAFTDEDDDAPWTAPPSRGRKHPPIVGPMPESLELVLGNEIYISKERLSPGIRNRLLRLAAFQNPEFYKAQAMRLPTYGKPRIIACAEDYSQHIGLPRGCLEDVRELLSDLKIRPVIQDERCDGKPLNATFNGLLRSDQKIAADTMAAHDTGVLAATTAFGKTVVAAWLIAHRGVNTLVLVHRRQLLEQWIDRLSTFLGLPANTIGRIGGGRKKGTGALDVGIIQSLVRKGVVDDRVGEYGHLVVDECHHLSAHSFEQVARRAKPRFVTGLSATVTRKDGHHPIIFMQCGPVRYRVDSKQQALARPFAHTVFVRPTGFQPLSAAALDLRSQFHQLYEELIADEVRNGLICQDVVQAVREGRSPVVLTERKDHLKRLAELLSSEVRHLILMRGGMGRKKLDDVMARLDAIPENEERVLLATGRYIGEGFDDARLDTLFLTLPVSWRGTIAQYAGRLHRLHDRKREVRIYDYADINVPMLARMFDRRCRGYEAVGYTILLLATLFVHAARTFPPDAVGAGRARSASEGFLYRRLETLTETAGKFNLNVELPIPFDGWGRMEVDLLCADARLAVELDGAQHLSDAEAYRRDRRKDLLLQENGYFVLRFLAEDVGTHLDDVLEMILRTFASRRRV